MIHLSEKTRQLPDRGITLPFMSANILAYLLGQNETLPWALSMPTTPITYAYDATCSTLSNTTGTTTINNYDTGNSSINTGKTPAIYNYDAICGLHQTESSSNNKATYADSNVYYYGYRYYSPELGRWPSRDPILEKGGLSLYVFSQNNPVNSVDFQGLVVIASAQGNTPKAPDPKKKAKGALKNLVGLLAGHAYDSLWEKAKWGSFGRRLAEGCAAGDPAGHFKKSDTKLAIPPTVKKTIKNFLKGLAGYPGTFAPDYNKSAMDLKRFRAFCMHGQEEVGLFLEVEVTFTFSWGPLGKQTVTETDKLLKGSKWAYSVCCCVTDEVQGKWYEP
jgi:RHS repeat-associated protein